MKKLRPNLGLLSVVTISISAMLGSGLFVLPGIAFTKQCADSLAGLFIGRSCCSYLPHYQKLNLLRHANKWWNLCLFRENLWTSSWNNRRTRRFWLSLLLKAALALVGFGAYLDVLTHIDLQLTSLSLLLLIVAINIIGTGKVSKFLTVIVFITIMLITILEFGSFTHFNPQSNTLDLTFGLKGLFSATALVFVSYAGVTKVAAIAEEILEPEKTSPGNSFITIYSYLLYCSVNYILTKTFSPSRI